jgi:hypothetical protein
MQKNCRFFPLKEIPDPHKLLRKRRFESTDRNDMAEKDSHVVRSFRVRYGTQSTFETRFGTGDFSLFREV